MNNFFTDFYYYTTDNELGKNETISNSTAFNFNKENKVQLVLIVSLVSQNLTNDLIYAPDVGILFWIIPFCFLSNVVMNR